MHQDGIRHTSSIVVLSILLTAQATTILLTQSTSAEPITLYVGQGEQYTTIQSALDNASDGYRIFVYNGTYHEHLTITKRIDLFGEDRTNTIINGTHTATTITITAPYVNISHFTITQSGPNATDRLIDLKAPNTIITDNILTNGHTGIYLNHTTNHLIHDNQITHLTGDGISLNTSNTNINISYNTITHCHNGIFATNSDNNRYYHNIITRNDHNGIFLNHSLTHNTIRYTDTSYNNHSGIYLNDDTNYTTITNTTATNNQDTGIAIENCSQTTITTTTIISNTNYGIKLIGTHTTITQSTITLNQKDGIYLSADNNNTITHTTITHNHLAGLRLYNATNDLITTNTIHHNTYGIYLDFFCTHNLITNNYLHNNTHNAEDKSITQNTWNTTPTPGTTIIGTPTLGGNYYDTYDETTEGAQDTNHDSIADTPYTINTTNKDYAPLLDTIPPTITTPHITPTIQTIGGTTTITVTATDNTRITSVTLNIRTPTNQHLTIPVTQNQTDTTYTYTHRFLTIGNYTCNITATDPRNTQTTTNQSFAIAPGLPPTVKDTSPKETAPNTIYTFSVNVTSSTTGASDLYVYANWIHNTRHGNTTLNYTTGNLFTASIQLDKSIRNMTYRIYAKDKWGNGILTANKSVRVIDQIPPKIIITRYGPSFTHLPGSFTYDALVKDNSRIVNVTIEYWTLSQPHRIVTMDPVTTELYEKIIIPTETSDRLYCILNATDEAGNHNDTRPPIAKITGPSRGMVHQNLTFNASTSFDLDGNITRYHWLFGDGTEAYGITSTHTYSANGTYSLTLIVTDDTDRNGTNTSFVKIGTFSVHYIPAGTLAEMNAQYGLNLTSRFYCYDSNDDDRVDTFYDPNNVLTVLHDSVLTLSNGQYFLLSANHDTIPVFLWSTANDGILPVSHNVGTILNNRVDEDAQQAFVTVETDKNQWIYLDVTDPYPNATLEVATGSRTIPSSLVWREDGHIYLLDDAETRYSFTFTNIYPPLEASFDPANGGIVGEYNPTITITFNAPVYLISATFGDTDIKDALVEVSTQVFLYTPPAYLANGTYPLILDAQAIQGTHFLSTDAAFIFFSYGVAPQKSLLEKYGLFIGLGILIGGLGAMLFLLRYKRISLDGSLYLRSKRILPFFKTVVVGPVSVRIDDARLDRAEFYVDGVLKETTTSFPYTWRWDEKAMFKHTLEAKVYDSEGNNVSTGPMNVFLFNPLGGIEKTQP